MSKNGKKARPPRRQPELSIRTRGFRLELDRLPRFPKPPRWLLGLLIGAVIGAAKLVFGMHLAG